MIEGLWQDVNRKDPLFVILLIQGDQIESIYRFIQDLMELNTGRAPFEDDMMYMYFSDLKVTKVVFRGNAWLYPMTKLVNTMKERVPVRGWSNWPLPFLNRDLERIGVVDLDMVGVTDFPGMGNLESIVARLSQTDVEMEEADAEVEEYERELNAAMEDLIPVDTAHE